MEQNKYDLNDPVIQWRLKVDKNKKDVDVRVMCNHEITHAVLKSINEIKNRKEDENAKLV